MDSKVSYALVGLFVIVMTIATIASIFWLNAGTEKKVYDSYQVYIKESVSGLNRKAPVKYRGVEVGYVSHIALDPKRPSEVFVLLDIEKNIPIKQDTTATLKSQGLTGLAYVELSGGSTDEPSLETKQGEVYPELGTTPSLFVRFDQSISSLLEKLDNISQTANTLLVNLDELSTTANRFLSEENRQTVATILQNIQSVTAILEQRKQYIDQGLVNTANLLDNTSEVMKTLPTLVTSLERTLSTIEETTQGFKKTGQQSSKLVKETRQEVKKISKTITTATKHLDTAIVTTHKDISFFMTKALPETINLLQEFGDLVVRLRAVTQNLEREPNMLLFGKSAPKPGPGE